MDGDHDPHDESIARDGERRAAAGAPARRSPVTSIDDNFVLYGQVDSVGVERTATAQARLGALVEDLDVIQGYQDNIDANAYHSHSMSMETAGKKNKYNSGKRDVEAQEHEPHHVDDDAREREHNMYKPSSGDEKEEVRSPTQVPLMADMSVPRSAQSESGSVGDIHVREDHEDVLKLNENVNDLDRSLHQIRMQLANEDNQSVLSVSA